MLLIKPSGIVKEGITNVKQMQSVLKSSKSVALHLRLQSSTSYFRLFHILAQFSCTTSEKELDYCHQNVRYELLQKSLRKGFKI